MQQEEKILKEYNRAKNDVIIRYEWKTKPWRWLKTKGQ